MGLDSFSTYPAHALGHPFSLMIQAAGMLAHGVFERFPKLRVAFLEGGATWVPFFMDRLDRSYHDGHVQLDLEGNLLGGPKPGEKASDYFKKQLCEGRIFVGFDCDDDGLGTAVKKGGRSRFSSAATSPTKFSTRPSAVMRSTSCSNATISRKPTRRPPWAATL